MAIWDRFRKQPVETKESAASRSMVLTPGQPTWSGRDYKAFAKEGYQRNVIAYQSICKIAEAIALPEPRLYRGDTEISESPLLDLLNRPNPTQDFDSYTASVVSYLMISGNTYQEKILIGNEPRELYSHRPDLIKVIPGTNGFPQAFEYSYNGRKTVWQFDADNILASEMWQTKLFNPLDAWYGMSPIEAGAFSTDQHNEAQKWMQALLQNSARPSGALVYEGENGSMSDDQFERLKSEVEANYQGARNAGRPMVLEGGLKWQAMGLSPTDMGIVDGKNSSARDIALAFGVPPQLLGIPGDNTYSNYKEARLAFWEDTVIPLLGTIYGAWNTWLTPHYGEGLELRPDLDDIPAIVDKRADIWAMADTSDDLTINEKRAMKGYGPVPGGDVVMVPANLIPMGEGIPDIDAKALADLAGYEDNVTPIARKAK